jgi:hypothetical protein
MWSQSPRKRYGLTLLGSPSLTAPVLLADHGKQAAAAAAHLRVDAAAAATVVIG